MIEISYLLSTLVVLLGAQNRGPQMWQERLEAGVLGTEIQQQSVDTSSWTLKDSQAAIEKVRSVLGVPREVTRITSKLIQLEDDNTPFLVMKLLDRPLWQVVVHDWRIDCLSAPGAARESSFTRTFDVLLRPEDGRIVKIRSRWPEGVPPIAPEPGATSATDQLRRAGNERYLGIPPSDPAITFLDALDGVVRGGGNPLTAKQIVGQYVLWSRVGYEKPRAVWAITLRGIPVYEAAYPGVPVDARNHLRYIVDAETGEWVCANSTPQPDESRPGDE